MTFGRFFCGGRPTGWSWAQMGFECSMPARPLPIGAGITPHLFVAMAALELQLVGAHLFVGSAQGFMALSLAFVLGFCCCGCGRR